MRASSALILLCACAHPRPAPPAPQAALPSAAPAPREAWCDREAVLEGPVTVAGSWGPGGAMVGCRTGPSPVLALQRSLAEDAGMRACLSAFGAQALEVELEVAGDGRVAEVAVLEASPAAPGPCVAHLRRLRFMALGCRWLAEHHWLAAP